MSSSEKKEIINTVIVYPWVLIFVSILINLFVFDIKPLAVGAPSTWSLVGLSLSGIIMALNHTWLMTTTEIVRTKFRIWATPEEWKKDGTSIDDVSKEGMSELQRNHNAHRNTTENSVVFAVLAIAFMYTAPSKWAAIVWLVGFAVSRSGYILSYLKGSDNMRGLFMTLSLLSIYGLVSYLAIGIIKLLL